jgi:hypothetical protein
MMVLRGGPGVLAPACRLGPDVGADLGKFRKLFHMGGSPVSLSCMGLAAARQLRRVLALAAAAADGGASADHAATAISRS